MWPWKHFPHSNIIKEASAKLWQTPRTTDKLTYDSFYYNYRSMEVLYLEKLSLTRRAISSQLAAKPRREAETTTLFFADDSLDEISSSSCRCQLTGSRLWHHKESKWRFRILQSSTSITEIRSSREDFRINSELIQSGQQTKILVT